MGAYQVKTTLLVETMETLISTTGSGSDDSRVMWRQFAKTRPPEASVSQVLCKSPLSPHDARPFPIDLPSLPR
jgi:hypothetical protein